MAVPSRPEGGRLEDDMPDIREHPRPSLALIETTMDEGEW